MTSRGATCPGLTPVSPRGRSWSASSCFSRLRWRECSHLAGPGGALAHAIGHGRHARGRRAAGLGQAGLTLACSVAITVSHSCSRFNTGTPTPPPSPHRSRRWAIGAATRPSRRVPAAVPRNPHRATAGAGRAHRRRPPPAQTHPRPQRATDSGHANLEPILTPASISDSKNVGLAGTVLFGD